MPVHAWIAKSGTTCHGVAALAALDSVRLTAIDTVGNMCGQYG